MAHFSAYGETAALVAATEGAIPNCTVTIPAGHRAVVKHMRGFTGETANCMLYLCFTAAAAANHLWGAGRTGVGDVGGDCHVFVDARAAAVVLLASAVIDTGTLITGCLMAGYTH